MDQAIVADIAGDNTAKGLIGGEKDDGYLTQIKGINKTLGDDADSINYYVPYLDLQVGTYTPGSGTNTKASLTMEITPMYNIVASTASDAKDVVLSDGENDERVTAVKVTDSQGKVFAKELKGLTDVKVDLPVPPAIGEDNGSIVYVIHKMSAQAQEAWQCKVQSKMVSVTLPASPRLYSRTTLRAPAWLSLTATTAA